MKLFFTAFLFVVVHFSAHGQALFACKQDDDCKIVDVCGQGYAVHKTKEKQAVATLGERGCAPVYSATELETHTAFCSIDKQCAMKERQFTENLYEGCTAHAGVNYEDCIIKESKAKQDLSVCDYLGFDASIRECKDFVMLDLILEGRLTSDFCDQVHISSAMSCWSELAVQESRPEHCLVFSDKQDVISCLGVPDQILQGKWEKLTPNICEQTKKIGLTHWSDLCFLQLSKNLKDLNYCTEIKTFFPFYKCYQERAVEDNDPVLCRMVESRGVYPKNYSRDIFSEEGCRYSVENNGEFPKKDKVILK